MKKIMPLTILLVLVYSISGFAQFIYGINGHSLSSSDYKDLGLKTQFESIKKIKASYYRIDILNDNVGNILENKKYLDSIFYYSQTYKIKILPNIKLPSLNYNDNDTMAYNKGYILGKGFAIKYEHYFPVIEIGNENDLKVIKIDGHGKFPSTYYTAKEKIMAAYFKGCIRGIKDVNDSLKTLIGISTSHTNFLQDMKNYGVMPDIIGDNWYGTDLYKNGIIDSVLNDIFKIYHKPIWITEINYGAIKSSNADIQKKWLHNMLTNLYKNNLVKAVFIYELFDQNRFLHSSKVNAREAIFGLYKVDNTETSNKFNFRY